MSMAERLTGATLLSLPQDVLDAHVRGYLDKQSALNFNEAVPSRRLVRRFPRAYAQLHHENMMIHKWAEMVHAANGSPLSEGRQRKIYRLVQDISRPLNAQVVLNYERFRLTLLQKMEEFLDTADAGGSRKWARMFRRLCLRTVTAFA